MHRASSRTCRQTLTASPAGCGIRFQQCPTTVGLRFLDLEGHSAKATPLSWMGKAGTKFDTQSLLGHHVLVGRGSALTYARDTQAAPVRKFEAFLGDVRREVFLPDSTRSGRFVPEVPEGPAVPSEGVLLGG